jgi:hypothetical protein
MPTLFLALFAAQPAPAIALDALSAPAAQRFDGREVVALFSAAAPCTTAGVP